MTHFFTHRGWAATLLAATLCVAACATAGSGNITNEQRSVATFSEISASGAINLNITVGPSLDVQVNGDDNLVPLVTTEVFEGKLVIAQNKPMTTAHGVTVTIQTPTLAAIEASGANNIKAEGLVGPQFSLELSGASEASLSGTVDVLAIHASGATNIDAQELAAKRVQIDLSGASNAEVDAQETLDVYASGAGSVRYTGQPKVTKEISGAASVEPKK